MKSIIKLHWFWMALCCIAPVLWAQEQPAPAPDVAPDAAAPDDHAMHEHQHTHAASSGPVVAPDAWDSEILEAAARIPIQDGGRVKPLDTYARFTLLQINGSREYRAPSGRKISSLEWMLYTTFYPEYARTFEVFLLQSPDIMNAVGLPDDKPRRRFAYNDIVPKRMQLFSLAQQYSQIEDPKLTPVQRQIINLAHNVHTFEVIAASLDFARSMVDVPDVNGLREVFGAETVTYTDALAKGPELMRSVMQAGTKPDDKALAFLGALESISEDSTALVILPPPVAANETWHSPAELFGLALGGQALSEAQLTAVKQLAQLESVKDERRSFLASIETLQKTLESQAAARGEYHKIGTEILLYKSQPFYWGLVLYVFAFVLVAFTWLMPGRQLLARLALLFTLAPLTLHLYGMTLRCIIRERPPVTTLYETLIFISAVAVLVAVIIEFMNHRRVGLSLAPVLGALGLFLANKYEVIEGRDTMPNLIAVLDTNFWLSTHVTTVTIGYAAGLLAGAIAHVYIVGKAVGFRKADKAFYHNIARMTYGVLCFGLLFATLGTVLGGIWANDSWGRFWGWDPKENGALMIVLWGLAVLHARMGGYIRDFGVNMAAVFGGIIVSFSWFGVNLLGVGLHSYGFTSGVHQALMTFYGSQVLVMMLGTIVLLREKVIGGPPPAAKA